MATKQLKPITPASRFASRPDFTEITTVSYTHLTLPTKA